MADKAAINAVRGVLLDVDGTLVDTNDFHARAWVEALAGEGIEVPFDAVRRRVGIGGDKMLPAVARIEKDSPQGQAVSNARGRIFRERFLPQVQGFPQVRELLQRMRDAGLTLALASGSEEDEVTAMLERAHVADLINVLSSAKNAPHSKPAPEPVQVALEKAGLAPAQVVMLGDTPYDIEAARKAGVGTIALRCGGWHEPDLTGALAIYDSPADLLAHFDGSPLAPRQRETAHAR